MEAVAGYFPSFIKTWSLFSAKGRGEGVVLSAIDCPLCPRISFGKLFLPIVVVGIEAFSTFSIPYGNDPQIPSVFGKSQLYIVLEEYFCILGLLV
jgi:hypothetical protein